MLLGGTAIGPIAQRPGTVNARPPNAVENETSVLSCGYARDGAYVIAGPCDVLARRHRGHVERSPVCSAVSVFRSRASLTAAPLCSHLSLGPLGP